MLIIVSSRVNPRCATMPNEDTGGLLTPLLKTLRLSYVHVACHRSKSRISTIDGELLACILYSTTYHRVFCPCSSILPQATKQRALVIQQSAFTRHFARTLAGSGCICA